MTGMPTSTNMPRTDGCLISCDITLKEKKTLRQINDIVEYGTSISQFRYRQRALIDLVDRLSAGRHGVQRIKKY
jgi:hypothetical protein